MTIKNKIVLLFVTIIVTVIVIGFGARQYLSMHYIHYKYEDAYQYYNSEEMTTTEFSEYLISEGFIVTEQQIPEYKTPDNISCHIQGNEIVVYNGNTPVLYAVLNENIVTDLNELLLVAVLLAIAVVVLTLIIVYVYFNRSIVYKLQTLERDMIDFKAIDLETRPKQVSNNEIDKLVSEFYQMAATIKAEDKQKRLLIMTLSHELKNPLSNIEAAIDMNRLGVSPYDNSEYLNQVLETQVSKMKNLVTDLLNAYKYEIDVMPQTIDIKATIEAVIAEHVNSENKLKIEYKGEDQVHLEINQKIFIHIISNLISNVNKYAMAGSTVDITLSNSKITFENKCKPHNDSHSTQVGLLINQFLSQEVNLEIEESQIDDIFSTTITFKAS